MNTPPLDSELSRLLSLASHEIRNPLSTVLGYIGFVTRDKRTEISEQHRQWLQLALNSCARLQEVAVQLSDYSRMVSGETKIVRKPTDVGMLLNEVIDALPPFPERAVTIEVKTKDPSVIVQADSVWLKTAFTSILTALRLEVGAEAGATEKLCVDHSTGEYQGKPASWFLVGDVRQLDRLRQQPKNELAWFNDKDRGNLGLTLWIAKWVLNAHGGGIWAPAEASKGGGGVVALPHA
jgi:signal transduction histidine kinase